MKLHENNGEITVVIDVSFTADMNEINQFILEEQCQFIDNQEVNSLKKFNWYINEETQTGTLIEVFTNSDGFAELAEKAIGTPVNLKFRELFTFEKMTILGDITETLRTMLETMNPVMKSYKGGLS
ncbi:hypothetical protein N9S32_01235 [Candidatus Actinomarina]|jgi:hypothetical protein|nr:hypothetical protein [Candidatus Actinomarina sp.]|tara:strand:+ start:1457 stop:1834 length:378 start_codon:yes stop_codon:yes gene_type:complete